MIFVTKAQHALAKSCHVVYDLTRLGPRQRIALVRAARTGIMTGNSIPNTLAMGIRKQEGLGIVRINNWSVYWNNLKEHDFDFLTSCASTIRLTAEAPDQFHLDSIKKAYDKKPEGWIRGSRDIRKHVTASASQSVLWLSSTPKLDIYPL